MFECKTIKCSIKIDLFEISYFILFYIKYELQEKRKFMNEKPVFPYIHIVRLESKIDEKKINK
jgi:hypothetical protein